MRKLVISLCIALSMTMCACGSINGNVEAPEEDKNLLNENEEKGESEDIEEFDPFDLLNVSFTGEDGSGEPLVGFNEESDYIRDLKYHIEDLSQELSNGDKVTITVAYKTNEDDYVAKYNKKPSVFSKEYVVESLDEAKSTNGDMDGLVEEFNKMLQGVWVAPTEYGPYYIYFDGNNNITKGWYSLDTSSVSHITNIEERENKEYFVEFECEDFKDSDGIPHDGYPYAGLYSSSDGFSTNLVAEDNDSTYGYTLVKAGNNMEEAEKYIKKEFKISDDTDSSGWIIGTWMNNVSDPVDAYSSQYQFIFHEDGTVDLTGYRNKDHGTYKDNGDGTATATFNECYFEGADSGSGKLEGLKYTVRISKGNNCIDVKFDDVFYKDGYSNASDGTYYKQ